MKSTFLFLVTTTMMTCTALGQPSNDKKNVLPDWAFGGFERPQGANPVISPVENTKFYCPMTQDYVAWESNDTFNPAATLHDGKIVVLYRAEDKSGVGIGHRTSRLGYATSSDGIHFKREKTPVFYPDNDTQKKLEWPGGCEDPRIAVTAEGLYVMTYTQWNRHIPRLAIATSRNLKDWTKHGPAFAKAYDGKFFNLGCKSGSILTEVVNGKQVIKKIDGKYFMYWGEEHVFAATSEDLVNWTPYVNTDGSLRKLFSPRDGLKKVEIWHVAAICLQGIRIAIPAGLILAIGAGPISSLLNAMPAWLTDGLAIGGGMVVAVGYAMVINMMATKEVWPFFAIGFVLATVSQITLIGLGAIGVALSLIYLTLSKKGDTVDGGSSNTGDPLGDIIDRY